MVKCYEAFNLTLDLICDQVLEIKTSTRKVQVKLEAKNIVRNYFISQSSENYFGFSD